MIAMHLSVWHVILPLLGAVICALFRSGKIAWGVSTLITWASFASVIALYLQVQRGGEVLYALGGHAAPFGIEYRIDTLTIYALLLLTFMASVMMPYAYSAVRKEIAEEKHHLFYTIYLLCFAGLLGIITTNDIFNIYVFVEISSLAMYTLIAMGRDRRALTASYEYLILGTIGATFFLIGVGILYMMTGTLNLGDMASRLPAVESRVPIQAAFAFITLGLALKVALFPLHIWLTNAYAYAPSFASAFLASTAAKVSVYLVVRLIYSLFGHDYSFVEMPLSVILATMAAAGIVVGSLTAIYQQNIKRRFAFSSVAQIAYIMLGIAIATETGLVATLLHMFNHALAKGVIFLALGAVYLRAGGIRAEHFLGIARYMPWTMGAFIIGGISLIGVPGTAGFISKWYLLSALWEKGWWPLFVLVLVSSLLAVMYVWRVVEKAFFRERPAEFPPVKEAPVTMLVPMYVLAAANIYFGIETSMTVGLSKMAAAYLMGGIGQ